LIDCFDVLWSEVVEAENFGIDYGFLDFALFDFDVADGE
jgi:hypothetical protein